VISAYDKSDSPLTVELDKGGRGGLGLVDIWVKDIDATFIVYGSCSGEEGTWRKLDELKVPHAGSDNRHESFSTAYRHIRVVNDSNTESEIEIVAGV